jgi:hypothetical protein
MLSHKECMPHMLAPLILFFLVPPPRGQAELRKSVPTQSLQPLQLRLTEPLRWENGCLRVSLELVNPSEKTIFLPAMGLYIDSSTKLLSSVAEKNGSEEWQNVYGFSDLLQLPNAKPLAPGASVRESYCVGPTVAVVKLQTETRRELPLRGRLKMSASYYLSDPNPTTNQTKSRLNSSSSRTWVTVVPPRPQVSTLIVSIPCPDGGCPKGCEGPPLILEGEGVIAPEVFLNQPEWIERGKVVDEELNRLFPCST